MGENYSIIQTMTLSDMVGVFIIFSIAIGAFALMWLDYRRYLDNKDSQEVNARFKVLEFVKKEQIYVFLFLMFLFLIGGEMLLYSKL